MCLQVISWSTLAPLQATPSHSHASPLHAPFHTHDLVCIATVLWDFVFTSWCCAYPENVRNQLFEASPASLSSRRRQLECMPITSLTEKVLPGLSDTLQHMESCFPISPVDIASLRTKVTEGLLELVRREKEFSVISLSSSIAAVREGTERRGRGQLQWRRPQQQSHH